ncbi:alpha/beta hydrolase family esterase [Solimonas terrae]|uniref:Poly(3-hydroxybutyrate) depolymerase n=1 Tax=Solimonas terrae TaxID=1396819 RepID=A0A6M2BWE4_9GAMM|nr:hypothetical protein [Solimonas terrae]NGY06299.1 hypothetical protein [Solimonas terrae]
MRPVSLLAALAAVCLLSVIVAAQAAVTPEENVVVFARTITDQNINRRIVYLRPRVLPAQAPPAFLLLPYRGGAADDMADLVHAARLVRKYGTWVIVPEAFNGYWNYKMLLGSLTTPDDVKFLDHVIDDAIATYGIDAHRIYMGGYSGGAMMTIRYACEVPGRIAGGALVGAQMITTLAGKCDTSAPPAMMFINGDEDPVGAYDGSSTLMSAPASAAFWAQANGCNATPQREALPDVVDDGTQTVVDRYSGCTSGEAVRLYSVLGGGHTWPGTVDFSPSLGRTSQDFDASDAFMQFLLQFSR